MHVRFHVAFELTRLRTGVIAKMTLVRLLSCVASPVDDQIALEFERLAAKLTTFTFQVGGSRVRWPG